MKKIIAFLLALVLAFAGCGTDAAPDLTETQPTEPDVSVNIPQVTVDNPVTYFQLSISDDAGAYISLTAFDDGMGMAYVEYVGDVKKVATLDPAVLHALAQEAEQAGLTALNGRNATGEGGEYASMYVSFADESYLGASWSGAVDQDFRDAYAVMEDWFEALLAEVPAYVPQPVVTGEVDADALAAMLEILEASGAEPLDMFCISQGDAYAAGLSASDGVTAITTCGPVMTSTAYSFTIVTLADGADVAGIRRDFEEHLDWNRWVCVSANSALIARKDNMVVCVMGSGDLYADTAWAIENTGWTDIETFENPDM